MLCMKNSFLKLSVLFVSSNLFWSSVARDCSPFSGENTAFNVYVNPLFILQCSELGTFSNVIRLFHSNQLINICQLICKENKNCIWKLIHNT